MHRSTAALALSALAALAACRESEIGSGGVQSQPIEPSASGSNGCAGANASLSTASTLQMLALGGLVLHDLSQICAARDAGELLYVTTAGGGVAALDLNADADPLNPGVDPTVTTLLTPSTPGQDGPIELYLQAAGLAYPEAPTNVDPVLSGIAVLNATTLAVIELSANVVFAVDRQTLDDFQHVAGFPDPFGGYADTAVSIASFDFRSEATQLCPTGDGRLFVADTGNHAVRMIAGGLVSTVAGFGAPITNDGDLAVTGFDSPVGLAVTCDDRLIVAEKGSFIGSGNRIRALSIGQFTFFGQQGSSSTLYGNGEELSEEGVGLLAKTARPVAPVVSSGGELYWIDSGTGTLRQATTTLVPAECPLFADCAAATVGVPTFTPSGVNALTLTEGGVLYVLQLADVDLVPGIEPAIYRVAP